MRMAPHGQGCGRCTHPLWPDEQPPTYFPGPKKQRIEAKESGRNFRADQVVTTTPRHE